MTEQRARVGVVGAGWWAGFVHLPALRDNPDAEIVGVCDRDVDRARRAAARFGVPHAVATVDELLGLGLDAVLVATPHHEHHGPAAAALSAGVDVMVEKPMTLRADEAWDLVGLARARDAHLHVGYTFPHSPHAARLRSVLRDGDIGPLIVVSSLFATAMTHLYGAEAAAHPPPATYADPAHGGGQLYSQLTHAVSLVLWLADLRPATVAAHGRGNRTSVDVADTLAVRMVDGTIASFATTGTLHDQSQRFEEYRFFGSDGYAALDTSRGTLEISRRGQGAPDTVPALSSETANPIAATSAALVATALGKAPVVVSGEVGALTVEVLQAARRSIETGEIVATQHG